MKAQHAARFGIYLVGMVLLALGITLNTKAGLGASAIVSVPYTVSQGTGWDFANLTLIVYCILVAAQFVIKGQNRRLIDLLQIVVSIVFTRFMALFQHGITYQSGFFCHRPAGAGAGHSADRHRCGHDGGYAADSQPR